jgi:hypothetical protein
VLRLIVTDTDIPSQRIVTLMVEALYSSEISVDTTATPRNVSEESILHTISLSVSNIAQTIRQLPSSVLSYGTGYREDVRGSPQSYM